VKKPENRSIAGVLLMLLIIPLFVGLMACMPVPIGDPERSRIDPDISGVWFLEFDEDELNGIYQLRPFDKRSWLMAGVPIELSSDMEGEPPDVETLAGAIAALEGFEVGSNGVTADGTALYKVWLTKLRGQVFMTWEPLEGFDEDGFEVPEFWYVFRVEKRGKDRIELYVVNAEHDVFEDLEKADENRFGHEFPRDVRRKWERALSKVAKNFDDEDLYGGPWVLQRVPESLLDKTDALFKEVIEAE
jgi:hypothetical protein